MGKKYLETKKGSLEEQVSLLEYYDPQYEGMTIAEVAALDEDALGVDIARGLMKHAKKGGFKIGGKTWNSGPMLKVRQAIGTKASKARAAKKDLEKQKAQSKADVAAASDRAELEARKKAKKDGVPDEALDDDGNVKQDKDGNTLYKGTDGKETSDPEKATTRKASPQDIDKAGETGRKKHDADSAPPKVKPKEKEKEKEPEDKDSGSDKTADQATSTDADADAPKSGQSKETGDSEGGTAHTSGGSSDALGDKKKKNPFAGGGDDDGDKEKTATPEPEKSGSEKPKEPEKTGDKQPEPAKPKGKHGGSRKGSGRKSGGKNQPKPGSPAKPDKPTPPKPKTEGVLKMTSQRMPDMREALKQVRETETKTHIVEVHEIGTDEYREYTEKVTPGQKTEKLTAKQKKIDVDKDGEIEGSDLAKLRKKKTEDQKSSVREMWAQAYKEVQEHKGDKPHKHPHEPVEEDDEKDEKEDKKLTMTGKKKEPVEINPNIKMEKKKQKNW